MSFALAGQLAGTAIAGPVGGFVGGFIGGMIDRSMAPDTEGPRLTDRAVQVSTLGAPIGIVFGSWRCTGNIIWPLNFEVDEHSHTEEVSQKGGGPEHKTYSYTATCAYLVCKGPKAGTGRMLMNKRLVIDENGNRDPCIGTMRVMLGEEDQEPDALMVARDGSAPAYRGSVIIVFEDLDLTDFGNRPPILEVEVFSNAETTGPAEPRVEYDGDSAPFGPGPAVLALVDPNTGYIWSSRPTLQFGATDTTYVTDDENQVLLNSFTTPFSPGVISDICYVPIESGVSTNEVWVGGWIFIANDYAIIYDADTVAHKETVDLGYRGTSRFEAFCYNPTDMKVVSTGFNGLCCVIDPATRTVESTFYRAGGQSCSKILVTTDYLAFFTHGGTNAVVLVRRDDYTHYATITGVYPGLPYTGFAYDPTRERLILAGGGAGLTYKVIDIATTLVSTYPLGAGEVGDADAGTSIQAPVYCPYNDRWIFGANNSSTLSTALYIVNPDTQLVESSYSYESTDSPPVSNLLLPPLLIPKDDPSYILSFDTGHIKRLNLGGTTLGGPVTLASIVQEISTCDPSGLDESDIDVSELTDLVDGYFIGQQMTRVAAIQPLMKTYFFDGVASEHILKFPKLGQAPVVTILKEVRAAHEAGSDTPGDLKITRAAELERPYRVDCNYVSAARDYQAANQYESRITRQSNQSVTLDLPIVLSDSKAKSVAMVNLYAAWLRTSFSFSTDASYAKYEPTDVVTLETDDAIYTARLVSRNDQGNGVIQWEAQIEDLAVYDQEGIVSVSDFVPQTVRDPGDTILHLIDSPILRDIDNDPGPYVAGAGTKPGWRGAELYKSADGSSWGTPILSITREATIGAAQSALPDFTAGNIFDNGNSVTVVLSSGGPLISATTNQVLNGSNTAVLGAHGRWEVINYKNATLIAPDTYQLSGLLRGRRGTEWARGTHEAGDTFILADPNTWQRPSTSSSEIGLLRHYKAPPFRTQLSAADEQSFINTAVGLKPYSVVNLRAKRSGTDLIIEWDPRSRIGYGPLHAIVPVGEATESYRIHVMDGAAVKREEFTTTPTFNYDSSMQTADWGSTTGPYTIQVAKMSATVGAGYIEEETLA